VLVLEATRSSLQKVIISGVSRCNVMHNPLKETEIISKGYPRGRRELLGPFNARFGPDDTYNAQDTRYSQRDQDTGTVFTRKDL
jgi:predicted flavoprotein YhiN